MTDDLTKIMREYGALLSNMDIFLASQALTAID